MPAPAVYILAIVGTIAAGIAFKEFVYEPHIAPKVEQWAEEFIAKRQARRRQRAGAVPVGVPVRSHNNNNNNEERRRGKGKGSDSGDDEGNEMRQSIELENLIAKEVREWRSEVNRSQTQEVRRRGNVGPSGSLRTLDSSVSSASGVGFVPMSPTHVLFDPSTPSTPSSTLPSVAASPSPRISTLRETASHSTLRSPAMPPTPAPSNRPPSPSLPPIPLSPTSIPSLSQSYPQDLDQEHGLELLSGPSSRADSPFSSFSHPLSLSAHNSALSSSNYYSFSPDPLPRPPSRSLSDLDFLSDFDPVSPRSSTSGVLLDAEEPHFDYHDDGVRSDSASSWASAGARSR